MTVAGTYGNGDNLVLLPAIILVLFASGAAVLDVIGKRSGRVRSEWIALFGLAGTAITGLALFRQYGFLSASGMSVFTAAQGAVTLDGLAFLTNAVVVGTTALFFLMSYRYLGDRNQNGSEYYALALLAAAGMYFMATGSELITLFLGSELSAICFYVMVGYTRADRRSNEAAVKYLLLGAVASGLLLYGFSLLYGIAGATDLSTIARVVAASDAKNPVLILAVVTISAGLLFKVAAVPFHTWTPDAYDGAPTPVTAFLSVASKIASFALLLRIIVFTLPSARSIWEPIFTVAAVLSITVGTIAAISQDRLKRLFAYSSISHSGYILLGVVAGNSTGLKGVYVYFVVYALMNLGSFAVLTSLATQGVEGETLRDLRGFARAHPTQAGLFVVLLVSLAGIPPTAGFLGKYYVLLALMEAGRYTLAAIASALVVVSLYFYFRLVREMYMRDVEATAPIAPSFGTHLVLAITSVLTLAVGLYPEPFLQAGFALAGVGK